jgi:hypothetical protein
VSGAKIHHVAQNKAPFSGALSSHARRVALERWPRRSQSPETLQSSAGVRMPSHLHSAEAGHVPWRTDSGRELGMVDRGRAPVAKPFHMHTLLRGAWCLMAWTPATRVHELSLRWCSGSCRASWYFFPPTTFKQSFFSLTHSLASLHSFRVPALPQVHPIHSPSLTSLRFFLHLHFACWHVLALTRNSSYLQTLTQDFVAPSLPAR